MTREAYLDALGITVWARRELDQPARSEPEPARQQIPAETARQPVEQSKAVADQPESPDKGSAHDASLAESSKALGLSIGPGQGSCLFLCGSEDDTTTKLASDLARLPGGAPVWAQTALSGEGVALDAAVEERLFTSVVIFGQAQALLALGGAAPEQCGAARIVVVPELKRLAADPAARKSCWQAFKSLGLGAVSER